MPVRVLRVMVVQWSIFLLIMNPEDVWKISGLLVFPFIWVPCSWGLEEINSVVCEPLFNRRSVAERAKHCSADRRPLGFIGLTLHWPAPALPRLVYSPSFTYTGNHSWHVSFESCVQCHTHINLNAVVKFTCIYHVWPFWCATNDYQTICVTLPLHIMCRVYHTPCFIAILHPHVVPNNMAYYFCKTQNKTPFIDFFQWKNAFLRFVFVLFPAKISNNS